MDPELLAAIEGVVSAFAELRVPFLVGGSVASSVHGIARSTLDADLVVDLAPSQVDGLVRRLEADYYIDREMILDALRRRSSFNLVHLGTALKIDIYVIAARQFDRQAFARRIEIEVGDATRPAALPIEAAEDVVLHKLEWYRKGGHVADRQWSDVLGVLRVQRDVLDLAYLRRWANDLGVADLLELALRDAAAG